ncbi:MAG: hypothetical protein AAFO07_32335, partial [Bacteroidota bacterium]
MSVVPGISAETIIFAINSAIKLSNNLRQLYAKKVRDEEMVLPIPDFDPTIKLFTMVRFFEKLPPEKLKNWDGLPEIHQKAFDQQELSSEEEKKYKELYTLLHGHQGGTGPYLEMSPEELLSIFKLQGNRKGDERTVLQLVAGSLVDIGVDYFIQVPGALNRESQHGKVLHRFLEAFDEIDFTEQGAIKREFSGVLLPRLFAAAAESVSELNHEISNDEKFQRLIKETSKGIANDIYRRVEDLDPLQREEAVQWGQLVLRSMIKHGGEYVLAAPESFLDTNKGVSSIIQSSGLVLLDAILEDESDKVVFKNALSPATLEGLTKATLNILAEHPELTSKEEGIKTIIKGVAAAVEQEEQLLEKGILPELVRIVLDQSAGNLDLLWKDTEDKPEHLLVVALGQTISMISAPQETGRWKPQFTKMQLLDLIEELLDEVVQNPAWITEEVNEKSILGEVLQVTLAALGKIPKDERLHPDVLRSMIRLNLQTTIANPKVLDLVPFGIEGEKEIVLQKALDLVLTFIFSEDGPKINRLPLLLDLLKYLSNTILKDHPDKKGLLLIQLILFDSGIDYSRGFDARLADELINVGLKALAKHPDLVDRPEAFHQILRGVVGALDSVQIRQPGLVARLIKLILQQSALHANLIIKAEAGAPKYLLIIILKQLLTGLS